MSIYELVCLIRQDMSSADVDKVTADFMALVKNFNGKVLENQYWGLKNLAYVIAKNRKAHFIFLGLEISNDCRIELERQIKLNMNIIRHLVVKVDKIKPTPEQMFKSLNAEISAINVTA